MIQTITLLVDAYRELNAKKLFWITLVLSGVIVAAFACVGLDAQGLKILWWSFPIPMFNTGTISLALFYKFVFVNFGAALWLSWAAMILAVVSTASIIPDFVTGGAVELSLSKPIGRVRLFLTKYVTALLFVALQVSVFSVASFLVIGLRGGAWEPRLFLAIPIVLGVFSYLFCICALVGLLTRSTIAALLLTLLFWIFLFILNAADTATLAIKTDMAGRMTAQEKRLVRQQSELERREHWARDQLNERAKADAAAKGEPEPAPGVWTIEQLDAADPTLPNVRAERGRIEKQLEESKDNITQLRRWNDGFVIAKTIFPKTTETTGLLERVLVSDEDLESLAKAFGGDERRGRRDPDRPDNDLETERQLRSRSVTWIVGTSLAFEGVVLFLTCWIFSRRDY
ncbi:MAG: ABC transporter permease [Phycisphaerae bacterium]|nr:ABC transporter permease [Phycisphaerae bacterium]